MPHICERLVAAARYLEANGMSVGHLRALHHLQKRPETFASSYRYFGTNKELDHKNQLYAQRLIFVADEHRRSGDSFDSLVRRAVSKWPMQA